MSRIDPVKLGKLYKADQTQFFLNTKKWRSFRTRYDISWSYVPFHSDSVGEVPSEPGLYAFVVSCDHPKLPNHAYVLYVGQSGHGASKADLRKRFRQYLREQKGGSSRPAVERMLMEFSEDLKFYFAAMPAAKESLEVIESRLLSAIIPPVNQKDFDAEVSVARRAAF